MDNHGGILIVDDSTASLCLLANILTVEGYSIRPTQDPKLAIQSAQANPPDLILLDVQMPEVNGFEVCRQLKKDARTAEVPIIFVSALERVEDRVRGFESGGVDFLIKPIQREEVLARVSTHLNLSQTQRTLEKQNTELAEAYHSIKESENKYRLLAENSPDVIYRMNIDDGRYSYVSPAATQLFGFPPEEWYENSSFVKDAIHPDWRQYFDEQWKDLSDGIVPVASEYQIIHRDGSIRWLNQRNIIERDESSHPTTLMAIVTDVTDQKNIEKQLYQAQKMEGIGQLAGGVAHDFNNILSAIIGFAEFIVRESPSPGKIAEDAGKIISASQRAAKLVQQILTFSRKAKISKTAFHPDLITREALGMLRATLPASITIDARIDSNCGVIQANPSNLHQVIINLCNNGFQAMAGQKGVLGIELKRKNVSRQDIPPGNSAEPGDYIVWKVSDTGCGIKETDLGRIFEPYFSTKEENGNGLGLSVVHGIINDCDGFIKVASKVGEGTVISVYIPVQEEMEVDAQPAESADRQQLDASISGKIMIVDDEPFLVEINKRRLEDMGFQVEAFSDSKKALERFQGQPDNFDMLITDQTMPKMTGEELSRAVIKLRPSLPVIMCTGHSETVSEKEALAMGISKYVLKPIQKNELLDAVKEILDS